MNHGFWRREQDERAPFPPARSAIAVTAPSVDVTAMVADRVEADGTLVLGPAPVDGGHRLLVMTTRRVPTVAILSHLRAELSRDNVALTVDVDPVDLG